MKVEIELRKDVTGLLEWHREERILHHTENEDVATHLGVKAYHLNQINFYTNATYEYLVNEYLLYQAYFADKKTD